MKLFQVIIHAKLFTVARAIEANNKAEAAAQVDQKGAVWMSVEEAEYED